jgi:hypothetical protein
MAAKCERRREPEKAIDHSYKKLSFEVAKVCGMVPVSLLLPKRLAQFQREKSKNRKHRTSEYNEHKIKQQTYISPRLKGLRIVPSS